MNKLMQSWSFVTEMGTSIREVSTDFITSDPDRSASLLQAPPSTPKQLNNSYGFKILDADGNPVTRVVYRGKLQAEDELEAQT